MLKLQFQACVTSPAALSGSIPKVWLDFSVNTSLLSQLYSIVHVQRTDELKKNRSAASIFLPFGDFVLIVGVFLLGYWLRHFALSDILEQMFSIPNDFRLGLWNYVVSGSVMACVELLMFRAFNVYRKEFGIASIEELASIIRVSFMAVIITFAFTFASRQLMFSRFVLIFAFPTTSIAIYSWHGL